MRGTSSHRPAIDLPRIKWRYSQECDPEFNSKAIIFDLTDIYRYKQLSSDSLFIAEILWFSKRNNDPWKIFSPSQHLAVGYRIFYWGTQTLKYEIAKVLMTTPSVLRDGERLWERSALLDSLPNIRRRQSLRLREQSMTRVVWENDSIITGTQTCLHLHST